MMTPPERSDEPFYAGVNGDEVSQVIPRCRSCCLKSFPSAVSLSERKKATLRLNRAEICLMRLIAMVLVSDLLV